MPISIALIVAAGRGHRASKTMPKQFAKLGGQVMLRLTIQKFLTHPAVSKVAVVIHPDDLTLYESAVEGLDLLPPIFGGAERQDSVRNGVNSLSAYQPDTILVHDAARPFVDAQTIDRVQDALKDEIAVIPALPVVDTLKKTNSTQKIVGTISRENLWRAQTPQGFRYDDFKQAHAKLAGQNLTDDAAICEAAGIAVAIVDGNANNTKITTIEDLQQANDRMMQSKMPRVGSGFDVHRYDIGKFVTLCGVEIPHDQGLAGHSDADVALHALTDALLGAIGEGDIGQHFPPSEMKWKGMASHVFVEHALSLIEKASGIISNVDITIICEQPKMGQHRDDMRQSVANMLKLDIDRVSVKATTTEKLGFTGRGEGVAAQASVLVMI